MSQAADNEAFVHRVQTRLRALGSYRGKIDSWAGEQTTVAFDAALPAGEQVAAWPMPDERSLIEFYGPPGPSNLKTVAIPYPMRLAWNHGTTVSKITCHRLVAESLVSCLEGILALYGDLESVQDARMDLYAGCYNKRPQRGGTAWSLHAWGAAIDIDSAQNGLHTPWPSKATMPVEVIEIFEAHGWKSGARAWGRDSMHFQASQ